MKKANPNGVGFLHGASDLTRTGDLLITSEMHYRLCYTSIQLPSYYTGNLKKSQLLFASGEISLHFHEKGAIIDGKKR